MKIVVPGELHKGESRVALIPAGARKLIERGARVEIQSGAAQAAGISDEDFRKIGAEINSDRTSLLTGADIVLRVRKPPLDEVELLPVNSIHISFLDPFHETELVRKLAARGVTSISMEMIPRTTIAQKMDALSSQANLAGYVAVILAATHLDKILPMMTTPAGTIAPSRVLVIGAGVAGLQAIATARRLGARVEAYDTRPVVEEQVRSLGAKFLKIDLGETGETKQGYANALTEEQQERQKSALAGYCSQADVIITTAQLFGRRAPVILTAEMIAGMKRGSVIVDLAVESGGNVQGSKLDEVVSVNGVQILGMGNLPARVSFHASQVYSSNLVNLLLEFWDQEKGQFGLDLQRDILKSTVITHAGRICNEQLAAAGGK